MRRPAKLLAPLVLLLLAVPAADGRTPTATLGGYGVRISLPQGWHGLAGPGVLQAADFPLPEDALDSAQSVRVVRGHVHLVVWDYGPSVPYLAASFPPARGPLTIARSDLSDAGLEGFPQGDVYAIRSVTVSGELLEIVADLGPGTTGVAALVRLNRVLATLRVGAARVLPPVGGRLAVDGVSLRLPVGWNGRILIPADRKEDPFVLRASRGRLQLVLLELPAGANGATAPHAALPVTLGAGQVLRRRPLTIARRVFSNGGRTFDLSVSGPSIAALTKANRLLATLTIAPQPWTFRSCNLSLRLPGTWTTAVDRLGGCHLAITLRGPGVRVILTELRPGQRADGQVLRRSGRRFQAEVTPRSAEHAAAAVLATLAAAARR